MKKYAPLIIIEVYLIATLLLLHLGPVEFKIHNEPFFSILLISYHGFFILGYYTSTKTFKKSKLSLEHIFSEKFYYISFFFAFVSALGTYSNVMQTTSFIPYNFFDNLITGLTEPGYIYTERMLNVNSGMESNSRIFNITSIFFAFFKLLFIFYFIYFWSQLGIFKKYMALFFSFFYISAGISSGTNSFVFIFFIFTSLSIFSIIYSRGHIQHLRKILLLSAFSSLIPVYSFGYIMSQRGGGFDYIPTTSPLRDISISAKHVDPEGGSIIDFFYYSYVWLDYYLVQGYYGLSLILDLDHNWTFGFGNSAFLQRQLNVITGIDITNLTYQHKISKYWDESAQWHSFYSHFANDFGITGLVIFLFILGYFVSRVWCTVIYNNSFYGVALLPIFAIMFIFFPANNQVFGYIDTLSYFVFISIFWFFEKRKVTHVSR